MVVQEVSDVSLIMVSEEQDIDVDDALSEGYIRIDWGTQFASLHEDYFPQRPIAAVRANVASIALGLIENCGGSAYVPTSLVSEKIEQGKLFRVNNTPEISLKAYAVFPIHGEHKNLIEQLLETLE